MTSRRSGWIGSLAIALFLLGAVPASAQTSNQATRVGQPVMGAVGVRVTVEEIMRQAAREPVPELTIMEEFEHERDDLPQNPASPRVAAIPNVPAHIDQVLSPQTVGTNFTGATLSGTNPTSAFPPDCMGAVGPTQYIVAVNNRIVSFNKTTGLADGVLNATTNTFFTSVRNGSGTSDPRIRYDRLTGRWFVVIINVSTPNRILFAVSDPGSAGVISGSTVFTYFFVPIATTPPAISSSCLADYPTLGIDANALYIGTNNFCPSFNGTDGYVIRKSSIMGAGPIVVTAFRSLATSSGAGPYTPQGVDNYDPAATEGYFIGVDNVSFGTLMMRRVSDPGGTPTISGNISITVPTTSNPLRVDHLGNTGGTSGRLDALDDRLFAAHIRNGRLWTAHNIAVNNTGAAAGTTTRNGARWYELNVPVGSGTPTIVESGTVYTATANNLTTERHYFIPSIMVSGQGHAALGFHTAGVNERANTATVGRLSGDGLGTTQTPVLITNSSTAYNPPSDTGAGRGARRWGDYSYTSLDPLDDMTMWTVEEFCDATNSYGVRVAKLIPPPPATPSALADITAGQASVNLTLTGVAVNGSGFYDPGANLPGVPAFVHLSAATSNGGATGTPPTVTSATYVNPTTVNLVLNASAATANIGAEKYTLTVTNPDGQTAAAAVVHVISNGPSATITASPTQAEGNAGTTGFDFTVTLSATTPDPVTINYQTTNGTATSADGDYQAATSFITIPPNTPSGTITVQVNGDTKREPDETFMVSLTGATNASIGAPSTGTATIQNDDPVPVLTIGNALVTEGTSGTSVMSFPVSMSNASSSVVTVNFQTADGTATVADNDYTAATSSINIPAGSTTGSIPVTVKGDTKHESDETMTVSLTGATNATVGVPASGTGTITNDDAVPTLSIADASVAEGNAGTTTLSFTVTLSNLTDQPVTAQWQTADGSATLANDDYQAGSGTLTIAANALSTTVSVTVNGDVKFEGNETLAVDLSAPTNATIADGHGVGTITNDDIQPTLAIDDVTVTEGNAGTATATLTVTLSNATDQTVTVHWQTADGSGTLANDDYVQASGDLTIPPKMLTATLDVSVNGDTKYEGDETFAVDLSSPTNASIGDGHGVVTITNDDVQPTISIADATVTEGDAGTTTASFTVTLSNATDQTVTVQYQTGDGSATLANDDYESASGTLTIPPKTLTGAIDVTVNGDIKFEGDETFAVTLSSPTNVSIADGSGQGMITNDDVQPTISIADATVTEGNAGTTTASFTVTLSNPTDQTVTVHYQTGDGSATLANNDYDSATGTLTIPPKELSGTIDVAVNGDVKFEGDETFAVTLSSPTNASIADGSAQGTITNDDTQPTISIGDATVTEGNAGTTTATFTVSLSNATDQTVTATWGTANGSATLADNDYVAGGGTVTIPAKETSATVDVTVNGDLKFEGDETFTVDLSSPSNATIGDGQGVGTILNDDEGEAPAVHVDYPNDPDIVLRVGNSQALMWTATDNVDVTTVDLLLSRDNGANYTTIATGEANDGVFDWLVTPPPTGMTSRLKVVAHDAASNAAEDVSDQPFEILAPPTATEAQVIREFVLLPVVPNPSAMPIKVEYALPREAHVRVSVVDLQGREIAVLYDGVRGAGRYGTGWDTTIDRTPAPAGMYFVRYRTPTSNLIRRFAIVR